MFMKLKREHKTMRQQNNTNKLNCSKQKLSQKNSLSPTTHKNHCKCKKQLLHALTWFFPGSQ